MVDGAWAPEDQRRYRALVRALLQGFGQTIAKQRIPVRDRTDATLDVAASWREQTSYAAYSLTHGSDRSSRRKRSPRVKRSSDYLRRYLEA